MKDGINTKDAVGLFRCDRSDKERAQLLAKAEGKSLSSLLRQLLAERASEVAAGYTRHPS